jgi:HlyD family secretion protein
MLHLLELVVTRPQGLYLLPNKEKQRRKIWFVVLGLSVVVVAGLLLARRQLNSQRNASFEAAKIGPIQAFITATGNLNPVVNVQVGSQVSGNIKALYADFNTKVRKGQLVAQIDPEIFQAQVDAASAAVNQYKASAAAADAQLARANSDIAAVPATRTSLQAVASKDYANFLNLQEQWRRSEGLFQEGVVSSQDHDIAKATFDAALAQLESDQAQIDAATRNIQSAQAQAVAVRAQPGAAVAQLEQAKATLAQTQASICSRGSLPATTSNCLCCTPMVSSEIPTTWPQRRSKRWASGTDSKVFRASFREANNKGYMSVTARCSLSNLRNGSVGANRRSSWKRASCFLEENRGGYACHGCQ